jgi:hypothetical protein
MPARTRRAAAQEAAESVAEAREQVQEIMMEAVFAHLCTGKDLGRAAQVARRWRDAAHSEGVWERACRAEQPLAVRLKARGGGCGLGWRGLCLQHTRSLRWAREEEEAPRHVALGPRRDCEYYKVVTTKSTWTPDMELNNEHVHLLPPGSVLATRAMVEKNDLFRVSRSSFVEELLGLQISRSSCSARRTR